MSMGQGNSGPSLLTPELLNRELHIGVMRNDVHRLRVALEANADPNEPWSNPAQPSVKDGRTPLIQAISLNHVNVAEILISAGADVKKPDISNCTPLWKAAYHGRDKLISPLVSAGADINEKNELNETPLLICAKHAFVHNNPECIKALVLYGAHLGSVDTEGRTALHLACLHSNWSTVNTVINFSKSLDVVDDNYMTPVYICVLQIIKVQNMRPNIPYSMFKRQADCAVQLIKRGCDDLGFASWLVSCANYRRYVDRDEELYSHVHNNVPDKLMHITRDTIQHHLGFTVNNHRDMVNTIDKLDIAPHLQVYLKRKTFSMRRLGLHDRRNR